MQLPVPPTTECTVCHEEPDEPLRPHPALGVALCGECAASYDETEWTKDEDGVDDYCRYAWGNWRGGG
jgi:hypothetical protein